MELYIIKHIIYSIVILFTTITGLIHFSKMDKASKIIVIAISLTTIVEITGIITSYNIE